MSIRDRKAGADGACIVGTLSKRDTLLKNIRHGSAICD